MSILKEEPSNDLGKVRPELQVILTKYKEGQITSPAQLIELLDQYVLEGILSSAEKHTFKNRKLGEAISTELLQKLSSFKK